MVLFYFLNKNKKKESNETMWSINNVSNLHYLPPKMQIEIFRSIILEENWNNNDNIVAIADNIVIEYLKLF